MSDDPNAGAKVWNPSDPWDEGMMYRLEKYSDGKVRNAKRIIIREGRLAKFGEAYFQDSLQQRVYNVDKMLRKANTEKLEAPGPMPDNWRELADRLTPPESNRPDSQPAYDLQDAFRQALNRENRIKREAREEARYEARRATRAALADFMATYHTPPVIIDQGRLKIGIDQAEPGGVLYTNQPDAWGARAISAPRIDDEVLNELEKATDRAASHEKPYTPEEKANLDRGWEVKPSSTGVGFEVFHAEKKLWFKVSGKPLADALCTFLMGDDPLAAEMRRQAREGWAG